MTLKNKKRHLTNFSYTTTTNVYTCVLQLSSPILTKDKQKHLRKTGDLIAA